LADHELIEPGERDHFAGTSAVQDGTEEEPERAQGPPAGRH
jgi:hypothetical protein